MIVEHELFQKQKRRKFSPKVCVELYELATELYDELDKIGIIQRMKDTPHLGVIRVNKNLKKSRYDYTILQLHFHQLIRIPKNKMQPTLKYTYNNYVRSEEFSSNLEYIDKTIKPTIYDLIQLLTIVYNIGHFYNTFVASRAAVLFADINENFKEQIIKASTEIMYRITAEKILKDANYLRYHLLNSLLVLQHCDQSKFSVQLAKEIIYAYLNEDELKEDSKLHYVFELFRSIRNIAYITYDLQIAKTPLTIDLCDSSFLIVLFKELLSIYNDSFSTKQLMSSLSKLLDDTVYNEESNAICYYMISNRIVNQLKYVPELSETDYYSLWKNKDSAFNREHPQHRDYIQKNILKLTFSNEHKWISQDLFYELSHTNGVRVGYYDRNKGDQTIVVSLKQNCKTKVQVAFRVLRLVISKLRGIPSINNDDDRYLLVSKFFLFYLLDENPIIIKPTVNPSVCVLCTKGKLQRIKAVRKAIQENFGNEDQVHEVDNLCHVLGKDLKNDVCISVPASVLVYNKDEEGKQLCEFDGMIIFPNRHSEQIVFLEAKNRKEKVFTSKRDLSDKLRKLHITFNEDDIQINGKDSILYHTL